MKLLRQLKGEKAWVLADQLVVSGSGFATNLLLARSLGITGFGIFSAIGMVQLFLLSASMAFGSQVYQVAYPSLDAKDKRQVTNGMLGQLLLAGCLILGGVLLFYFLAPARVAQWLMVTNNVLLMAGAAIVLFLLQDFLRKVFITQHKARYAFVIDAITNILQLAVLIVLWQWHSITQFSAWLVIAASFVPSVITGIVLLRAGLPGNRQAIRFSWSLQRRKSGWLLGSSILQWGAGYFFVIAAGWWVGPAALGALRLAQYIYGILNVLLQAVENYALPRAAAAGQNRRAYWKALQLKCFVLIGPWLLLLAVFGRQVLQLAGGEAYTQYTYLMYGLSLIYVLITFGYPTRIVVRALHMDKAYFTAYIISVVLSISAAPWLLGKWQLYGVLAGLFLTQVATTGYWLIILQRKHSLLWKSSI